MACPCFRPSGALSPSMWPGSLRPPLGEVQGGRCAAAGSAMRLSDARLVDLCNLGYARATCEHFPADEPVDAVRFNVAGDTGKTVSIAYSRERNHLPCSHGVLTYYRETAEWGGLDESAPAKELVQAYLDSYLRWKETA